ncbi:Uncharacterised protein [Bordetella pertussis]|nr:Uncharacterised protein [Bordetella pertussis]CFW47140.1 Uncharacterised protein [Bordetella pertussis]
MLYGRLPTTLSPWPNCAKSTVKASASTTVSRSAGYCRRRRAARSRSISTAVR